MKWVQAAWENCSKPQVISSGLKVQLSLGRAGGAGIKSVEGLHSTALSPYPPPQDKNVGGDLQKERTASMLLFPPQIPASATATPLLTFHPPAVSKNRGQTPWFLATPLYWQAGVVQVRYDINH